MLGKSVVAVVVAIGLFVSVGLTRPLHAASATQGSSLYVSGFGGITFLSDADLYQSGFGSSTFAYDAGAGFGASAGYRWAMGLRAEFELSYRSNDVDTIDGVSVSGVDTSSLAYMGNLWYDFDTGSDFIPYLGAGVGAATVTLDLGPSDFSDTVFAWQIGGGLGYQITPGLVLFADYRWLATVDAVIIEASPDVKLEYNSHNIMFGVRFHF